MSKPKSTPEAGEKQVEENPVDCHEKISEAVQTEALTSAEMMPLIYSFYCKKCDLGFMFEENYQIHLNGFIHKYNCFLKCIHCGARFSKETELHSHKTVMHKDKAIECKNEPQKSETPSKNVLQVAMADQFSGSGKTREARLKERRKRHQKRREERRRSSSSSSPAHDNQPRVSSRQGRDKVKTRRPKRRGVRSASAVPVATAGSTSHGQTQNDLNKTTPRKSADGQMNIKNETDTDSSADSYAEDYRQGASQKYMKDIRKLLDELTNISLNSCTGDVEQSPRRLLRSKSCEWPRPSEKM